MALLPNHKIEVVGTRGLLTPANREPIIMEVSRQLPGGRRWWEGRLWFEDMPANWATLYRLLPQAEWTEAAQMKVRGAARLDQQREEMIRRRQNLDLPAEIIKWCFRRQPYQHQLQTWAMSRNEKVFAYLMDMGTGKTKVTIDVAAWLYLSGEIDSVLVVAPNGVQRQWVQKALGEHMPEPVPYRGLVLTSDMDRVKSRSKKLSDLLGWDGGLRIGAINVEAASIGSGVAVIERFLRASRCLLVLDESARFKNADATRTKNMTKLAKLAKYRRILTGTPITKGLEDLFAQFRILDPNILGFSTFTAFRSRFCIMGGYEGRDIVGYQNEAELHRLIAPYSVRVAKEDCLDLPPKVYVERDFALSKEQKVMYHKMKEEALAQLPESGAVVEVLHAAAIVQKLHQIACGFLMDKAEDEKESRVVWRAEVNPRLDLLQEVWEDAQRPKTIIWCKFREDIRAVKERMDKLKVRSVVYQGGMKPLEQTEVVNTFAMGRADVFIGQEDAGGTGLDGLQIATLMIYYSNSHNAESRWQSEDRAHRIGQTASLTIVDLIARGTVDRRTIQVLRQRESLAVRTYEALRMLLNEGEDEDGGPIVDAVAA